VGKNFVNDSDMRRIFRVMFGEITAASQGNLHGFKIIVGDNACVGLSLDQLFLMATLPLSPHFVIGNHREEDAAYDRPRLESLLFSISCPVPIC
jgi:hypothetical protein